MDPMDPMIEATQKNETYTRGMERNPILEEEKIGWTIVLFVSIKKKSIH